MRARPGPRVVVTGMGVVSSIGTGIRDFTAALRAGTDGAAPVTAFDTTGYPTNHACEVTGFEPGRWVRRHDVRDLGRASQFAVAAARMALTDSALVPETVRDLPTLVAMGTTDGGHRELDDLTAAELTAGAESWDPRTVRSLPASRVSSVVAAELQFTDAEAVTLTTACAAGNYAIGYAADAIRSGEVSYALAGGADAFCRKTFTGFLRMGVMAATKCRPFDVHRDGMLTGEGAGVLLLESAESAAARGARVYAEVLGHGLTCDAHHPVAPDRGSVARCMALALADAGVRPADVDLISAHATGTEANDVAEVGAIRDVFGERPPRTVAVKSMLGHAMGAASALASIACVAAVDGGFVPPTINFTAPGPDSPPDCVPNVSVPARLRVVLNNALAFGGNNCSVVFGEPEERR
ncbi:beta-ketoacyl-[acyl-carrier-protein] synthase family protein [Kibdelosporangium lantanae]